MPKILLAAVIFMCSSVCNAQVLSFVGVPAVRISEGGVERFAEKLEQSKSKEFVCVVKEIDGKFIWASRENKPLVKIDTGGAFVIYVAVDGSGYIRQIKPNFKNAASLMSSTEKSFDYIEHLLLGLRTVTYYGMAN
jgi:hypothetical protein